MKRAAYFLPFLVVGLAACPSADDDDDPGDLDALWEEISPLGTVAAQLTGAPLDDDDDDDDDFGDDDDFDDDDDFGDDDDDFGDDDDDSIYEPCFPDGARS